MDKKVEDLIALGKDSVIELALEAINSKSYQTNEKARRENFKKIKIFTNGKNIYASFFNPIIYLPEETVFYCNFRIELLGWKPYVINRVSNPLDYSSTIPDYNIPFYKETKETKKNIQFVFEAINKSNEIGSIGDGSNFEDNMTIREYKNYYDIVVHSKFTKSWYKVEKISGKIYDAGHKHKALHSLEIENEYKEIHWD